MDFISHLVRLKIVPFIKRWNILGFLLGTIDILAIALAFQCSYFINYFEQGGFFFSDPRLLKIFLLIMPFWLVILYLIQITEIPRTKRYRAVSYTHLRAHETVLDL